MVHIRRKMGVYIPFCGRYKLVSGYITTDRAKQKVHIFADTKN